MYQNVVAIAWLLLAELVAREGQDLEPAEMAKIFVQLLQSSVLKVCVATLRGHVYQEHHLSSKELKVDFLLTVNRRGFQAVEGLAGRNQLAHDDDAEGRRWQTHSSVS